MSVVELKSESAVVELAECVQVQDKKKMSTVASGRSGAGAPPLEKRISFDLLRVSLENAPAAEVPYEIPVGGKGTLLRDALLPFLQTRNKSFDQLNVFVKGSNTPLPTPATIETYFLAGQQLILKEKGPSEASSSSGVSPLPIRPAVAVRSEKHARLRQVSISSTLTSTAEEDPANPAEEQKEEERRLRSASVGAAFLRAEKTEKRGSFSLLRANNRLSAFFSGSSLSLKEEVWTVESLQEFLDKYSRNTVVNHSSSYIPQEIQELLSSKSGYEHLLPNVAEMRKQDIQQQMAMWELIQTEDSYLRGLKIMCNYFQPCLAKLQSLGILSEINMDSIFSNIHAIFEANQTIWYSSFFLILFREHDGDEKLTELPLLNPATLETTFLQFGEICRAYKDYCLSYMKCRKYCEANYKANQLFKVFLDWCSAQSENKKLKLVEMLASPYQRLPRYPLVLKAILKYTDDYKGKKCLQRIIKHIETVITWVDDGMKDAEVEDLEQRMYYGVVDVRGDEELAELVKRFSVPLLSEPMPAMPGAGTGGGSKPAALKRGRLEEVEAKIRDSISTKDVHCFLFTDLLLICRPKGERYKIIRQPFFLCRLIPGNSRSSRDPSSSSFGFVYLNELKTAVAAFTLQFSEAEVGRSFVAKIKKAKITHVQIQQSGKEKVVEQQPALPVPASAATSPAMNSSPLPVVPQGSDSEDEEKSSSGFFSVAASDSRFLWSRTPSYRRSPKSPTSPVAPVVAASPTSPSYYSMHMRMRRGKSLSYLTQVPAYPSSSNSTSLTVPRTARTRGRNNNSPAPAAEPPPVLRRALLPLRTHLRKSFTNLVLKDSASAKEAEAEETCPLLLLSDTEADADPFDDDDQEQQEKSLSYEVFKETNLLLEARKSTASTDITISSVSDGEEPCEASSGFDCTYFARTSSSESVLENPSAAAAAAARKKRSSDAGAGAGAAEEEEAGDKQQERGVAQSLSSSSLPEENNNNFK